MLPAAVEYANNYSPEIYNYLKYVDPRILKALTDDNKSVDAKTVILNRYPKLEDCLTACEKVTGSQDAVICDMDICATVCEWQKSKQIYRFDKDFLNELLNTESFHFQKDIWTHLPAPCIYADISDAEELCDKIDCAGLFIRINKGINDSAWQIHAVCINRAHNIGEFHLYYAWNEDKIMKTETFDDIADALTDMRKSLDERFDVERDKYVRKDLDDNIRFKATVIYNFICQALTYLSSAEPDIDENTKAAVFTASQPSKKKKHRNVPSKIKTWDIGFRYGDAFRKWKEEKNASDNASARSAPEHTMTKRPHYRRAHWHSFWYGKLDGERVKKVRWISGILVNNKTESTLPAVIHDVETDKEK